MSTRFRAYLTGLVLGSGVVGYVNHRFIKTPQAEILFDLRRALMSEHVHEGLIDDSPTKGISQNSPLLSRQTLNLALIAISDRYIFQE